MKIIDAHMHFSNIRRFINTARSISMVDYSAEGLEKELLQSNVYSCIAMGITETTPKAFPDKNAKNPMGADLESYIPKNMKCCIGFNPFDLTKNSIADIETELKSSEVVGLKIYPGYYPFHICDKIYKPIYELAEKYELPVVIHTGDTFSYRGYLEFSHPLAVNQLAGEHKNVNFVIAHFGNPWVMDTAVVLSNNTNVFADLSGLIVGSKEKIQDLGRNRLYIDNIKRGLVYDNVYDKLMFGTDWPLVPIDEYVNFIKLLIPKEYYEDVFWNNAFKVFKRLNVENVIKLYN